MVFVHHLYPVQEKGQKQEQEKTDARTFPFFPGTSTVFTWNQNKTNYFWNRLDEGIFTAKT